MTMLNYDMLDDEQVKLIDRLYEFNETIVYATMGSGKTVCYLTAISELIAQGEIKRALIVAPLNPCKYVWAQEHTKWAHLQHLSVAVACGTPQERMKAFYSGSDIVVINIENLVWFLDIFKKEHNFDALCIDELSKFGDSGNKSVKKLRAYTKTFKHRVGLTGTPVHEGFEKLFSQVLMIDGGARLGTNKRMFLNKYFYATDYNQYNWELLPDMDKALLARIDDLMYAMPDYTDTLPELREHRIDVELNLIAQDTYRKFAQESVLLTPRMNAPIVAESAAVLSGKLEQFANGFVYDEDKTAHEFHTDKLDAFKQFIDDWNGYPLLVFYQFQYDKQVISTALDDAGLCFATIDSNGGIEAFLNGQVNVLLLHPKSAGHGLNLHTNGANQIVCYCPIWSNDQYKQLIGRLWRRGAKSAVDVWSIVSVDTIDELKLERVDDKTAHDKALRSHLDSMRG